MPVGGPSRPNPPIVVLPGKTDGPCVPTGPECNCEDNGNIGNGLGEGPMRREGEPGADTKGPRAPGKLNAELLGGPRLELKPIDARLELKFPSGSTCFEENNYKII